MVVLDESVGRGMTSSQPDRPSMATRRGRSAAGFGSPSICLLNRGVPANVISPRNPSYAALRQAQLDGARGRRLHPARPLTWLSSPRASTIEAQVCRAKYAADLEAITSRMRTRTGSRLGSTTRPTDVEPVTR
jgi:hypothetical protein